jgi:serine/threonine protein phosphatase 1
MGKVFVIGDIHGAYRALIQCMELSRFDRDNDHLICLGDVCDGWPETKRSIDELLRIKTLTYLLGNHDTWLLSWMTTGEIENIWYVQGGAASIMSYAGKPVPPSHLGLLKNAKACLELGDKLFVHAGIQRHLPLEQQSNEIFLWDRTLARTALDFYSKGIPEKLTAWEEIYVGHTPTRFGKPVRACEVWLMDTGAGWDGVLSMMDIETKQCFISDPVPSLYPGIKGRTRNSF